MNLVNLTWYLICFAVGFLVGKFFIPLTAAVKTFREELKAIKADKIGDELNG